MLLLQTLMMASLFLVDVTMNPCFNGEDDIINAGSTDDNYFMATRFKGAFRSTIIM